MVPKSFRGYAKVPRYANYSIGYANYSIGYANYNIGGNRIRKIIALGVLEKLSGFAGGQQMKKVENP